jgi:hypothetical protein
MTSNRSTLWIVPSVALAASPRIRSAISSLAHMCSLESHRTTDISFPLSRSPRKGSAGHHLGAPGREHVRGKTHRVRAEGREEGKSPGPSASFAGAEKEGQNPRLLRVYRFLEIRRRLNRLGGKRRDVQLQEVPTLIRLEQIGDRVRGCSRDGRNDERARVATKAYGMSKKFVPSAEPRIVNVNVGEPVPTLKTTTAPPGLTLGPVGRVVDRTLLHRVAEASVKGSWTGWHYRSKGRAFWPRRLELGCEQPLQPAEPARQPQ